VIRWVMPLGLGAILMAWAVRSAVPQLSLEHVAAENRRYIVAARLFLAAMLAASWCSCASRRAPWRGGPRYDRGGLDLPGAGLGRRDRPVRGVPGQGLAPAAARQPRLKLG
jgi:hypothetical protein